MRKYLRFIVLLLCAVLVPQGMLAQQTFSFGNGSTVEVNNGVATFSLAQAGDLASFNKNSDNTLQNAWNNVNSIVITGTLNAQDIAKFSDDQTFKGRLDLSEAEGDLTPILEGNVANPVNPVIFPHGFDLETFIKKHQQNYAIAVGSPLMVYTRNGDQGCLNDPLVTDSEVLWIYNVQNGTEVKPLKSGDNVFNQLYDGGKVINGQYKNPETVHFDGGEGHEAIIDASNAADMSRLQDAIDDPKKVIGNLVITGKLNNLAYLSPISVSSLDLSGLTNESLDGLSLPKTSGNILFPGTVTYNASTKTVTADAGTSLDKMQDEMAALKNAKKEIASITFPDGSVANTNDKKLTIVSADADNIKGICQVTNASGITLETIEFPSGSKVQWGRQLDIVSGDIANMENICEAVGASGIFDKANNPTINLNGQAIYQNGEINIPEAYKDNVTDIIKAVKAAGLDFTKIKINNELKWNNGSVTPNATEEADLANFNKQFTDAGLDVTQVKTTSGSIFTSGKLRVSNADDNVERLTALKQELESAGFTIRTVELPGDMTWYDNKKLIVEENASQDVVSAAEEKLRSAGFEIDEDDNIVQVVGQYVKVLNGVTILTLPTDGLNGQLKDVLTPAEMQALKNASNLKLVGKFTTDNMNNIQDEGQCKPTVLDLSEAILDEGVAINQRSSGFKGSVQELILPNDPTFMKVPADFCKGFSSLNSVTIPSQIKEIGKEAFQDCTHLDEVDFSEADNLKVIGDGAFQRSAIGGNLVIPNSVETIGEWAFGQCLNITAVTINKGTNLWKDGIKNCAFEMNSEQGHGDNNNKLKNVYIFEDDPNHLIPCDVHAFGYDNTDGQTNMATVKTRLNYPPNLYWYYVGEWKSQVNGGKVEGQKDLMDLRNVIEEGSSTIEGEEVVATPYGRIGWQLFVSSGIPVTADVTWRTYSDIVHIRVPKKIHEVADVYIVCGYSDEHGAELKQMKEDDVIPAGTGVVIHHYVKDQAVGGVLMFPHVTEGEAQAMADLRPYRYVSEDDLRGEAGQSLWAGSDSKYVGISTRDYTPTGESTSYHNYLEAIHCMGVKRAIYNAENGNYVDWATLLMARKSGQKVTYRNFFFGNGKQLQEAKETYEQYGNDPVNNPNNYGDYTGDDWRADVEGEMGWGFFRAVSAMYAVNSKAFLHYPAVVYSYRDGISMGTTEGGKQIQAKQFGFFIVDDEIGVVTDIQPEEVKKAPQGDVYYNLQGVRISKPTKSGIYIHNGKKIVVR